MGKLSNRLILAVACVAILFAHTAAFATKRSFWVWDLNVMPPGARQVEATLRADGKRSRIYVEDALWQKNIQEDFVQRLNRRLEAKAPEGAYLPNIGVVPLLEEIFAPLPSVINPDPRVIVLFADLGQYKNHQFDGFFNAFDQMREEDAWKGHQQHSNQANIIYINGMRKSEAYTEAVIAHETLHLLAYHAPGAPDFHQQLWLSEVLGEGAMLLSGYYTDQGHVDRYLQDPAAHSLVANTYVQYGPQLLFASFLIDTLKRSGGLGTITRSQLLGKEAIVDIFRTRNGGATLTFDAIFSLFLSYVSDAAQSGTKLPSTWKHSAETGLKVTDLRTYGEVAIPGHAEGTLVPYAFAPYMLGRNLPDNASVHLELLEGSGSCANGNGSVFWKPLSPRMLAIYSIGCEQQGKEDKLRFRLTISEQPRISPHATIPFFSR